MSDQNTIAPTTGASQPDVLIEMAEEVKIPLSDLFISIGVPLEFFKEDAQAQARNQVQAEAELESINRELEIAETEQARIALAAASDVPVAGINVGTIMLNRKKVRDLTVARGAAQANVAALGTLQTLFPQLFLVETYRLTTQRTGKGKGPAVTSVPLMPGEEKTYQITTSFTSTTDITKTTTAMESQDSTVTDNLNSHIADTSAKSGGDDAVKYHMEANAHGDASMGIGSGEVNASVNVQGGCNTVRSDFSNTVENAMDKQIGQTSASREQNVSTQASTASSTQQTSTVSTDTIKNPNPTRAVTVFWYQLLEQFTSFLSLVNVEVAFKNGDPMRDAQGPIPLHDLDKLLNEVLEPSRISEVRQAIKSQLEIVLDFQDEVRNIVEEVPIDPNKTFIRLKQNLQSTYVLKDGNGNPLRNINVDGVLLKVISRIIPSRLLVMDLVVAATSAV